MNLELLRGAIDERAQRGDPPMSIADAVEFLGSVAVSVEDAAYVIECGIVASVLVSTDGCVSSGPGRVQGGERR
jgi:hypothetical protein